MPEEGITLTPNSHLLTSDEIIKIASIFVSEGVKKVNSFIVLMYFSFIYFPLLAHWLQTLESSLAKYF